MQMRKPPKKKKMNHAIKCLKSCETFQEIEFLFLLTSITIFTALNI